ncbi:MAG: hypothetical protein LBB17_02570 [Puniceicoccales bacterium]|nr:hypothetical protein [Puniceicoccales bacterium]
MDSIKKTTNNTVIMSSGIGLGSSLHAFTKNEKNNEQEILAAHMLTNANFGLPMCRLRFKKIAVSKKNMAAQSPFVDDSKIFDVISPQCFPISLAFPSIIFQ